MFTVCQTSNDERAAQAKYMHVMFHMLNNSSYRPHTVAYHLIFAMDVVQGKFGVSSGFNPNGFELSVGQLVSFSKLLYEPGKQISYLQDVMLSSPRSDP